jgi:hypothetical protein
MCRAGGRGRADDGGGRGVGGGGGPGGGRGRGSTGGRSAGGAGLRRGPRGGGGSSPGRRRCRCGRAAAVAAPPSEVRRQWAGRRGPPARDWLYLIPPFILKEWVIFTSLPQKNKEFCSSTCSRRGGDLIVKKNSGEGSRIREVLDCNNALLLARGGGSLSCRFDTFRSNISVLPSLARLSGSVNISSSCTFRSDFLLL